MANLGNLIMYGVGPFVSYDAINWICLSGPVIFLLSSLWIPESPYYHLKNGNIDKAGKAMMQLKGLKTTEVWFTYSFEGFFVIIASDVMHFLDSIAVPFIEVVIE